MGRGMPGEYRPARRRAQTWCGRLPHACFGFVPESTLKRVQPAGQLPTALMPITSDTRGVSTMPICIPRTFELSSRSIFLLVGNIPDVHTPLNRSVGRIANAWGWRGDPVLRQSPSPGGDRPSRTGFVSPIRVMRASSMRLSLYSISNTPRCPNGVGCPS